MRENSYPKRGYRHSRIAISFARILEKIFPRPRFGQGGFNHPSPSILFIELFGLGDVASLSVTFDPLLKRFPTAKICILCQPWCASFYANDSRVFEVIGMPTPWKSALADLVSWTAWASVIRIVRQMRKKDLIGASKQGETFGAKSWLDGFSPFDLWDREIIWDPT